MQGETRRPSDFAVLLLASGDEPPRQRARDQQADLAGLSLKRRILDRFITLDPEPLRDSVVSTLDQIILEIGPPSGPTRAIASAFVEEWDQAEHTPGLWEYLLAQAIASGEQR